MHCYCDWDGDGLKPEVFRAEVRTARKHRVCIECDAKIAPDTQYQCATGLWDNIGWETYATCLSCAGIRRDYAPMAPFGELRLSIIECLGFDPAPPIKQGCKDDRSD